MITQSQGSQDVVKGLLSTYNPSRDHYDEYLSPENQPREAWQKFEQDLRMFSMEDLSSRQQTVERIIQENGITYNIYDENQGKSHPWTMDVIPMILSNNEFRWMESALIQRLKLFNEILSDVYGEQKLIRSGVLPPSLVYSNPAFQRSCYNTQAKGRTHIQIYAADLARSPDGRWWVVSDRVDAPSGIGYAMENRFITNRVMPDLFRDSSVLRIQSFFQQLRETLENLVIRNTEEPNIVLLTPGPANETYFEQSFLARNLGLSLVEGADLTVRDNRVYLKTLNGMRLVDVILRRLDSGFCDPLELRKDSLLGVPGLINAVRNGNVAVVNSIGSGIVESAVMKAFLPNLAVHVLGQDLMMPSIATWWCGQENEKSYVLDHLENLVIKSAFKQSGMKTIFGHLLSEGERNRYRDLIRKNPNFYCAQEMMTRATTPVFHQNVIEPRHFLLRVFLIEQNGSYTMMPGGLTRITDSPNSMNVSMQSGGQSKDTWILASEFKKTPDVKLPNTGPVILQRQMSQLPSRMADNIFWLGRYVERTEHQVRLLRIMIERHLEESVESESLETTIPFYESLVTPFQFKLYWKERDPSKSTSRVLEEIISKHLWNLEIGSSLQSTLRSLILNAYAVKERLSIDTWFIISRLQKIYEQYERGSSGMVFVQSSLTELNDVLTYIAGINGMSSENMTRYHDWRLLDLGRRLERINNIVSVVENTMLHINSHERSILHNLLIYADSLYTYRGRYLTNLQPVAVLDLLIADDTNPRSAAYQSTRIQEHIQNLPQIREENPMSRLEKYALNTFSQLRLADLNVLATADKNNKRVELEKFSDNLLEGVHKLSDLMQSQYFAHGKSGEYYIGK